MKLVEYEEEAALYHDPVLCKLLPEILHSSNNADGRISSRSGVPFPPFLVLERGVTLSQWSNSPQTFFTVRSFAPKKCTTRYSDRAWPPLDSPCHVCGRRGGRRVSVEFTCLPHEGRVSCVSRRSVAHASCMQIIVMLHELAKLLSELHASGRVHRDLKPDNTLYLLKSMRWKLLDLGIAARTGAYPTDYASPVSASS